MLGFSRSMDGLRAPTLVPKLYFGTQLLLKLYFMVVTKCFLLISARSEIVFRNAIALEIVFHGSYEVLSFNIPTGFYSIAGKCLYSISQWDFIA